jgi:hypothetical protein
MSAGPVTRALAGLALCLVGCISPAPESDIPPMCERADDCDSAAGEVCDEGVCWGDPPTEARFAAVLVPPAERADLPVAVIPLVSIAQDGLIGGLDFPEAVVVHGRVLLACPEGEAPYPCGEAVSVGAQIVIERAPIYPGGRPTIRAVVAAPGIGAGQDAFSFLLPRDPDAEYRITIQPDDSVGGDQVAPGQIAPPRQIALRADRNRQVDWVIGDPAELKTLRGCVQNVVGEGAPYAGMKVVAFGRWTQLSPLERASSRSVTGPDGCFELSVPRDMLDEFDISVQPGEGAVLPSFTLRGEFVRDPIEGEDVHTIDPLVMPSAPAPTAFRLPIEAQSSAGGQERVAGAVVRLVTDFTAPTQNGDRAVEIRFETQAVTSGGGNEEKEEGVAQVQLYPGGEENRRYLVSVVPPAGSQFQSAFERELSVGIGGAEVLQALTLERRTALRGEAKDKDGEPIVDSPIEARPSALFRQGLDHEVLEAAVAALPVATTTTDDSGRFLLWLDRELVGQAASYDIDVTPPIYSGAPSWSVDDVSMPSDGMPLDLEPIELPEASFARATVRDARKKPVPGAEVYLYELPPEDYCADLMEPAPGDCDPPAKLRGLWRSDKEGIVRVVLPDP